MPDLSTFWLQMLGIAIAISLLGLLRLDARWFAGRVLQLVALLAVVAYGLLGGPADTCALVVGAGLVGITFWPQVLIRRFRVHVSLLDAASAREEAQRLRLFQWGRPGRFWVDTADALALALDGEGAAAEARLRGYLDPRVPRQVRDAARNTMYTLLVLDRAWERILLELEVYTPDDDTPLPIGLAMAAHRAYLEVGQPAAALAVLARADFLGARQDARGLQLYQLAYRSLTGDVAGTRALGTALALPPHALLPWVARAQARTGELEAARASLAEAIAAVPPDQAHLAARLERLADELEDEPPLGTDPATAGLRAAADERYAAALRQEALLSAAHLHPAVLGLVAAIAAAFVPAHLYQALGHDRWLDLADWILQRGQLTVAALHGEPWRLLTYQFMHADVFHVALNLLVLWLFGMRAVALFGPWTFLALFFGTGVLGGLAQVELVPASQAVGASGAVLGIFSGVIAGTWRAKVLPAPVRKDQVARLLSVAALQFALDQVFAGQIAVAVHAAGMISGALLGLVAPLKR